MIVQTFYNGLHANTQILIDVVTDGSMNNKKRAEVYKECMPSWFLFKPRIVTLAFSNMSTMERVFINHSHEQYLFFYLL